MTKRFRLSGQAFSRIATGDTSADDVESLRESVLNHIWHGLWGLVDWVQSYADKAQLDPASGRDFLASWAWIQAQNALHPEAVRTTLGYPSNGGWVYSTIRDIDELAGFNSNTKTKTHHGDHPLLQAHLAQMGSLAASLALRINAKFSGLCQVRRGMIRLPGLGALVVRDDYEGRTAELCIEQGGYITSPALPEPVQLEPDNLSQAVPGCWRPLWVVRAEAEGLVLEVTLDDLDLYGPDVREGQPATLDEAEAGRWHDVLAQAWELLVRHHRRSAEAVAAGLQMLVPLKSSQPGSDRAATVADLWGAILMSLPRQAVDGAKTFVHEFVAHGILSAFLREYPVFEYAGDYNPNEQLLYAAWRDDARPPWALLQGVYAFVAELGFWRQSLDYTKGPLRNRGLYECYRWPNATADSLERLRENARLTSNGQYFLKLVLERLRSLQLPDAPPAIRGAAEMAADDHLLSWRMNNQSVLDCSDDGDLARLVRLWKENGLPGDFSLEARVDIGQRDRPQARRMYVSWVACHPGSVDFDRPIEQIACLIPGITRPDVEFAAGNFAAARDGYRQEIGLNRLRVQSWVGWALACRGLEEPWTQRSDWRTLVWTAYQVYKQLLGAQGANETLPEPHQLVEWLASEG